MISVRQASKVIHTLSYISVKPAFTLIVHPVTQNNPVGVALNAFVLCAKTKHSRTANSSADIPDVSVYAAV